MGGERGEVLHRVVELKKRNRPDYWLKLIRSESDSFSVSLFGLLFAFFLSSPGQN